MGSLLAIAISVVFLVWSIMHEPEPAPSPPPPPIATPGSGISFAPFVFIDKETGCEYLSTHLSNALTPRLAADGVTHKGCTATSK